MFDSIIFLFVVHAYDVGDKIECEGVEYFVRSMSIMVTILHTIDGREVYYPNSVLATKNIR